LLQLAPDDRTLGQTTRLTHLQEREGDDGMGRAVTQARSRSPIAPAVRSQMMRSIRKVDTGPERHVRQLLRQIGARDIGCTLRTFRARPTS
jgi:hypothetical protein